MASPLEIVWSRKVTLLLSTWTYCEAALRFEYGVSMVTSGKVSTTKFKWSLAMAFVQSLQKFENLLIEYEHVFASGRWWWIYHWRFHAFYFCEDFVRNLHLYDFSVHHFWCFESDWNLRFVGLVWRQLLNRLHIFECYDPRLVNKGWTDLIMFVHIRFK